MKHSGYAIWRRELENLGFRALDLHSFESQLSTSEVQHIVSLSKSRRYPTETNCYFGVRSNSIEDFAFASLKMALHPSLHSFAGRQPPSACILNYDFIVFSDKFADWSLDNGDVAGSVYKLRKVVNDELTPVYRTCQSYEHLLELLSHDHRLYRWASVNAVARASYVVALAEMAGLDGKMTLELLNPFRKQIEQMIDKSSSYNFSSLVAALVRKWEEYKGLVK